MKSIVHGIVVDSHCIYYFHLHVLVWSNKGIGRIDGADIANVWVYCPQNFSRLRPTPISVVLTHWSSVQTMFKWFSLLSKFLCYNYKCRPMSSHASIFCVFLGPLWSFIHSWSWIHGRGIWGQKRLWSEKSSTYGGYLPKLPHWQNQQKPTKTCHWQNQLKPIKTN